MEGNLKKDGHNKSYIHWHNLHKQLLVLDL